MNIWYDPTSILKKVGERAPGFSRCSHTFNKYYLNLWSMPVSRKRDENTRNCVLVGETHSSTLAWKITWTEEPGRLQSMGSLGVGHD